jgi:similar to stage IV sporulation protein
MSTFIWLVEVNGLERVDRQALLEFCEDNGLYTGARKGDVDRRSLEKAVVLSFSDISFINIGFKGTKAEISIAESIPKQEIVDKSLPCDIIAEKDGIISSIYVMNGTPRVREKDVVSKGDLLVSGELSAGTEYETQVVGYAHSQAEVRARLYYEISFKVRENYTEKVFSGRSKTAYSLNILNKDLKLFNYSNLYANYDRIIERNQIEFGENYPLPVIIVKDIYKEYEPVVRNRTLEDMKAVAEVMINNRIIREFDFDADIMDKIIEYSEDENGLSVKATVVTDEDIGEIRYIQTDMMNTEEETKVTPVVTN